MGKGNFKASRGTKDIYSDELAYLEVIEAISGGIVKRRGYQRIVTPTFENAALFNRAAGDTSDVVKKEMFEFLDKGDRKLALRPEGTAGVVRAAIERSLLEEVLPKRLYYFGPCFRNERPQAGRFKEFYQFGAELFGSSSYLADVEIIETAYAIFERLKVKGLKLKLNSLGCDKCSKLYKKALIDYLKKVEDKLCESCKLRLGQNPLRVLDCKNEHCAVVVKNAPKTLDYLCCECKDHFSSLKRGLKGLMIEFEVDPMVVRGLDYYNRTVFEFISSDLGAQSAVCGGGRYDELVQNLGGKDTPALGFAIGVERLSQILQKQGEIKTQKKEYELFIGFVGVSAGEKVFMLAKELRDKGISVTSEVMGRSVKAQMRYAGRTGAQFSCIIGDDELKEGIVKVKDLKGGDIFKFNLDSFSKEFINLCGKERDN